MERGTREYTLWTVGLIAIVVVAIFPVFWILSLSLKDPATISDGRLIPAEFTLDNYEVRW